MQITDPQTVAETIRKKVSGLKLVFGGSNQVTVSIGIASVSPFGQMPEESLLHEADKALYCAKSAGRNRVAFVRLDADK